MYIKELKLHNFRNFENETFTFGKGLNILHGANAQGKTNTGEAIFYLCTGYSPKASRDTQLVRNGETEGCVTGTAVGMYGEVDVKINVSKSDKKSIFVNGTKINRYGELMGNINAVFFNPHELKLVQESPEDRRRFLNISLSEQSRNYFYALQKYNKILEQRNALLKDRDYRTVLDTLPVWDKTLAKVGAKIIKARIDFMKLLAPKAQEFHSYITENKELLELSMENGYTDDIDEIETKLLAGLEGGRERDMRLGYTCIGPHRDDIKIHLNGEDVKVYGSQGQQRTVALSMKMAEVSVFENVFKEKPILILDDVMSELDRKRQKRLISALGDIQAIVTTTNVDGGLYKVPHTRFEIRKGRLFKVKEIK